MFPSMFEISNFRLFKKISIPVNSRISLITGMNNVGKTAILEALYLWIHRDNPYVVKELLENRGYNLAQDSFQEIPWASFFPSWNTSSPITITCDVGENTFEILEISVEEPTETLLKVESMNSNAHDQNSSDVRSVSEKLIFKVFSEKNKEISIKYSNTLKYDQFGFSVQRRLLKHTTNDFFINSIVHRKKSDNAALFSALDLAGKASTIVNDLKVIEPTLKRLAVITSGREAAIFGDAGLAHMLSLQDMGEGINRLLTILLRIASAQGGYVIIDEIENGFHYSKYQDLWKLIHHAAVQYDVRVITTTHSYECIEAATKIFHNQNPDLFSIIRMEKTEKGFISIPISSETAYDIIDANLEVR